MKFRWFYPGFYAMSSVFFLILMCMTIADSQAYHNEDAHKMEGVITEKFTVTTGEPGGTLRTFYYFHVRKESCPCNVTLSVDRETYDLYDLGETFEWVEVIPSEDLPVLGSAVIFLFASVILGLLTLMSLPKRDEVR